MLLEAGLALLAVESVVVMAMLVQSERLLQLWCLATFATRTSKAQDLCPLHLLSTTAPPSVQRGCICGMAGHLKSRMLSLPALSLPPPLPHPPPLPPGPPDRRADLSHCSPDGSFERAGQAQVTRAFGAEGSGVCQCHA